MLNLRQTLASDDLGDLVGPILLGAFFNAILFGALAVQALLYFQTFTRDSSSLKLFVAYLLIVETLSTGFDLGLAYEPLIVRRVGNAVTAVPSMLATVGAVTVFVSSPVQVYLAIRLRAVLKSNIVPGIVVLLSLVAFAGGIATSINVVLQPTFASMKTYSYAPSMWLASAALADGLITASLCWFLYKNKSGFKAFDSVVNRIIILTIQTGALTSLAASADLIVYLAAKGNYMFIWDLALTKLYSNSLLSTLNARKAWNELIDEGRPSSSHLSFIDVERALSHSQGSQAHGQSKPPSFNLLVPISSSLHPPVDTRRGR